MAYICPKCETEFFDRIKYCPDCGFDFTAALKKCPKCRSQVPVKSETCPECGLDFEKYAFLIPRLVVFGSLTIVILIVLVFPWIWKASPWMHDKGKITDGFVMTEADNERLVPLFIHWKSGERYIEAGAELAGYRANTDYMDKLLPLPPEIVFHYDMRIGEKVWIIRRIRSFNHEWVQIGRWNRGNDRYGWVHSGNIEVPE